MRHDFSSQTKALLASRVGFKCSNPGCRQTTSGPRRDPSGAVNVGVAAHITAAAPGGPRYDADLTPEQRSSVTNGIWLCQTDAKLIDNDVDQYPVDCLRRWKTQAEEAAHRELEVRLRRSPDGEEVFRRMERLMPVLLEEMRADLKSHPLKREFILMSKGWMYNAGREVPLAYYYEDHEDLGDKVGLLVNHGLVTDITYNNVARYVMSEPLAEYLGAP